MVSQKIWIFWTHIQNRNYLVGGNNHKMRVYMRTVKIMCMWWFSHLVSLLLYCRQFRILQGLATVSVLNILLIFHCPFPSSSKKIISGGIPRGTDMSERRARTTTSPSHNSHCCKLQCCSAAMHWVKRQACVYHWPYSRHCMREATNEL